MRVKFLITLLAFSISMLSFSQEIEKRIGTWRIYNGYLIKNSSINNDLAAKYWGELNKIFPKTMLKKYIKRLVLMTDGPDEKTGALVSLSKGNDKWQLVIDIEDVNFNSKDRKRLYESVYTLVHEFGHLITLNKEQIRPTKQKVERNGLYLTHEGEAYKNSYINRFVNLFWKKEGLLEEWDYIQREHCYTEANCVDKLSEMYMENFSEFITDYAAESPEEDIVESWTAFVLRPKIKRPRTTAQKKINFFYQFPELVRIRTQIKQNTRRYLH